MEFHAYGANFSHAVGEFSTRLCFPYYFLGYFHTDFVYEKNGVLTEGEAGSFMIVPPGVTVYHGPRPDAERGFINDWMHVSGEDLEALLSRFCLPLLTPIRADARFLGTAISRIQRERSYRPEGFEEKCALILSEALIDIYRSYRESIGPRAKVQLDAVRGRVMQSYMQGWTVSEMAALAGLSASRFSAVYKQTYGIAPIEDLMRTRIENAKQLLRYSGARISEIADAVGFSSLYYFSRAFKKLVGQAPSEYREMADEPNI